MSQDYQYQSTFEELWEKYEHQYRVDWVDSFMDEGPENERVFELSYTDSVFKKSAEHFIEQKINDRMEGDEDE